MQPIEHTNHEHASTSLKVILLVFAIVLVGTLGYLVWDFNRTPDTTDNSTPVAKKKTENTTTNSTNQSNKTSNTVKEDLFSVILPVGWTKVSKNTATGRECDTGNNTEYHYQDSAGNYFDVCVDPVGRGLSTDITWVLVRTSTGFKIKTEGEQCVKTEEGYPCPAGDNKLFMFLKTDDGGELNNHTYYFTAGNTKKETGVNLEIFRDIIHSFKVN